MAACLEINQELLLPKKCRQSIDILELLVLS